jgi:hypothetical protein
MNIYANMETASETLERVRAKARCLPLGTKRLSMNPAAVTAGRTGAPVTSRPSLPRPQDFTVEEHLAVQRHIEQRAYQLGCAQPCSGCPLQHWLQAENEVLAEFIRRRLAEAPAQPR